MMVCRCSAMLCVVLSQLLCFGAEASKLPPSPVFYIEGEVTTINKRYEEHPNVDPSLFDYVFGIKTVKRLYWDLTVKIDKRKLYQDVYSDKLEKEPKCSKVESLKEMVYQIPLSDSYLFEKGIIKNGSKIKALTNKSGDERYSGDFVMIDTTWKDKAISGGVEIKYCR